jgi:tetratricopeptide (TPR) repeat protein
MILLFMDKSNLVQRIRSFGAFIPEKFYELFNEEHRILGESVFRQYPQDISISTGGLYLAMTLPVNKYWADLVKEHFRRLKELDPQDPVEINNKAFAYDTLGFYRDPSGKNERWKRIADHFGIDGFRTLQPMYEEAIRKEPTLWEPRYNLAEGLLHLCSWGEDPANDSTDFERAFEELNAVLGIDSRNIPARLRLASTTFHDFRDPYQLYEEVLEIDPDNKEAKEGIERLRKMGYDFKIYSTVSMIAKKISDPMNPNLN